MTKKDDSFSTAPRVKAYRDRLSSGGFKRVEAYVTVEEKSRIDAVMTQLGVTTDVAVAGLLRMGLEQYEKQSTASPSPSVACALYSAGMETVQAGAALTTQGAAMLGGGLSPSAVVSSQLCSFTNASTAEIGALSVAASALCANAAPASLNAAYNAATIQNNDNNPIARFFKHRKEMNKNA